MMQLRRLSMGLFTGHLPLIASILDAALPTHSAGKIVTEKACHDALR